MRRNQFLALCAVAAIGGTIGGYAGRLGPSEARAQYVVPPNSPNQNVRTENVLFIPDGGLRMVTGQNRTIGYLGSSNGAATMALFDQRGQPAVMLSGDNGGQIWLQGGTTSIKMGNRSEQGVLLTYDGKTSTFKLREGVSLTSANDGGRLQLNDSRGDARLRIDGPADGGRVTGFGKGGVQRFEIKGAAEEGLFDLFGKGSEAGFRARGSGSATVTVDKKAVWKVPKTEDGGGQ